MLQGAEWNTTLAAMLRLDRLHGFIRQSLDRLNSLTLVLNIRNQIKILKNFKSSDAAYERMDMVFALDNRRAPLRNIVQKNGPLEHISLFRCKEIWRIHCWVLKNKSNCNYRVPSNIAVILLLEEVPRVSNHSNQLLINILHDIFDCREPFFLNFARIAPQISEHFRFFLVVVFDLPNKHREELVEIIVFHCLSHWWSLDLRSYLVYSI